MCTRNIVWPIIGDYYQHMLSAILNLPFYMQELVVCGTLLYDLQIHKLIQLYSFLSILFFIDSSYKQHIGLGGGLTFVYIFIFPLKPLVTLRNLMLLLLVCFGDIKSVVNFNFLSPFTKF